MADTAITSVRKSYGKTEVVKRLNLSIASGNFVVVPGPRAAASPSASHDRRAR